MKKIILIILLISSISFPQYYSERSTEQSFEQSELYFTSHFLNTFGLKNFKKVSVGLLDDPFLNVYLNPATRIDFGEDNFLFYLDFRGDRTEAEVMGYAYPFWGGLRTAYFPGPDIRWIGTTRTEPEPIFSLGIITNPLKGITDNFFVGGTYQLLYREEKFYKNPYWIFYPRFGYDTFGGARLGLDASIPMEDRYYGADQMINSGHLLTLFTSYEVDDKLNAGLFFNAVTHSREGDFSNLNRDEYRSSNLSHWESSITNSRTQNYNHWDLALGVSYQLTEQFNAGVKAGYLKGKADQNNLHEIFDYSKRDSSSVNKDWFNHYAKSSTNQNWNQDGNTKYFSLNFQNKVDDSKVFGGYYRYSQNNTDFLNTSNILDTSRYSSKWVFNNDTSWNRHEGISTAFDARTGRGTRVKAAHEMMLSFHWKVSKRNTLYSGIYLSSSKLEIDGNEPVTAKRMSSYSSTNNTGNQPYNYFRDLVEDKNLVWRYVSSEWSLQIPILFHFQITDTWGAMIGVNRYFYSWKITDQTVAYFKHRRENNDGVIIEERNFAERYTQPITRLTENYTDVIVSFDANITKKLNVKMTIDPEFDPILRFAQWWLSFNARL